MPFRRTVQDHFVHIEWYGILRPADFAQLLLEVPRIGRSLGYAPNILHTFDEVLEIGMDFASLSSHSRQREAIYLPNKVKVATVSERLLVFGFSRMIELMNETPMMEMRVFKLRAEAEAWLGDGDGRKPLGQPMS